MRKFVIIFIEHLKLLFHPVIINAFIFFDKQKNIVHKNWGDDINYYFLREIIRRPIVLFNRTSLAFRLMMKNYLVIGSTIDMLSNCNTEIWGAGIINRVDVLDIKFKKIHAVRGPLTRQKLIDKGYKCPEIYGDPALLLPFYYQPKKEKLYNWGIISHVSNQDFIGKITIKGKSIIHSQEILIIDLQKYEHWHEIIDKICSCKAILSSSLHGLIVAEAYNIPNLWIEFGLPLIGEHFKFHDFFLSIHRDREAPFHVNSGELSVDDVNKQLSMWKRGTIDLELLMKACPFPLKRPINKDEYSIYV